MKIKEAVAIINDPENTDPKTGTLKYEPIVVKAVITLALKGWMLAVLAHITKDKKPDGGIN